MSHLYEVEANIFIKWIQYECRQSIMTPSSMNQQQPFQKPKLKQETVAY